MGFPDATDRLYSMLMVHHRFYPGMAPTLQNAPSAAPPPWTLCERDPFPAAGGEEPQQPGDGEENENGGEHRTGLLLKPRPKTKKPSMYKVLLLNDDYTPMEFVVHILERFFNKNRQEATDIMLHVHRRGVGVCGIFTYEIAESKVAQVMDFARANEQPLQCTMEKE